jgi:hypothetical protein
MATERVRSIRNAKPRYETSAGEWVPGVTTILGLRAKPALTGWAFKIARDNPNLSSLNDYMDDLAEIGTVVHLLIAAHLKGEQPDLSDHAPSVIDAARPSYNKFLEWERGKTIEVIGAEIPLVSDVYRYGGTIDLVANIDGRTAVLDFKTGKAIYAEYFYQTAAYAQLVKECIGLTVADLRILQIGRTGNEGFGERVLSDYQNYWLAFKALRDLYQAERDIEVFERPKKQAQVVDIEDLRKRGVITRDDTATEKKEENQ